MPTCKSFTTFADINIIYATHTIHTPLLAALPYAVRTFGIVSHSHSTTDDSIIAKVETISEENVTYHRYSNLSIPLYSIRPDNISSIRYANGSKDVFTSKKQRVVIQQDNFLTNKSENLFVTRTGNTYFYNGQSMNKEEYCRFLQYKCQPAYQKDRSGHYTAMVGWAFFSARLGLDIGNVMDIVIANRGTYYTTLNYIFAITAGCLEIASIPCLAVGYAKMHKSVDIYNVLSASRAQCQPYWSVQANPNGIGLALNF